MTIYNKDDLGYRIDNNVILRLKTGGSDDNTSSSVFNSVALPDITVDIRVKHTQTQYDKY